MDQSRNTKMINLKVNIFMKVTIKMMLNNTNLMRIHQQMLRKPKLTRNPQKKEKM